MEAEFRALVGTIGFDKGVTFVELPILGWKGTDPIVEDGGEILTLSEIDCEGSDAIAEILVRGEVATREQKIDMADALFLRMMHYGVL